MERTPTDLLRVNEKLRLDSGVIANLGTALVAAGFGRWLLTGVDGWAVDWIAFGGMGMAVAIQLMSFLHAENENG